MENGQRTRRRQNENQSSGYFVASGDRMGQLVERQYQDDTGRDWTVMVPENETNLSLGIPVGPPDTSALDLPEDVAVALHNQLNARRLFTYANGKHRINEIEAALKAALRVDVIKVLNALQGG